jgi:hypothetical protein
MPVQHLFGLAVSAQIRHDHPIALREEGHLVVKEAATHHHTVYKDHRRAASCVGDIQGNAIAQHVSRHAFMLPFSAVRSADSPVVIVIIIIVIVIIVVVIAWFWRGHVIRVERGY